MIYTENHFNLYIEDFLFYNMSSYLRKIEIQSHNTAYNLACKLGRLLLDSFVFNVFSKIYLFPVSENLSKIGDSPNILTNHYKYGKDLSGRSPK